MMAASIPAHADGFPAKAHGSITIDPDVLQVILDIGITASE